MSKKKKVYNTDTIIADLEVHYFQWKDLYEVAQKVVSDKLAKGEIGATTNGGKTATKIAEWSVMNDAQKHMIAINKQYKDYTGASIMNLDFNDDPRIA